MTSRYLVLAGLLSIALLASGCGSTEVWEAQIQALDEQIATLQEQVLTTEGDLTTCVAKGEQLTTDLAAARQKSAELQAEVDEVVFLSLDETLTFGADEYRVTDAMESTLAAVAMKAMQYPDWDLFVVGHSDRAPQSAELQYYIPSAWELAAFRSSAVAKHLIDKQSLPAVRVIACSQGASVPVADNDTAEGRAANRRVTFFMRAPQ